MPIYSKHGKTTISVHFRLTANKLIILIINLFLTSTTQLQKFYNEIKILLYHNTIKVYVAFGRDTIKQFTHIKQRRSKFQGVFTLTVVESWALAWMQSWKQKSSAPVTMGILIYYAIMYWKFAFWKLQKKLLLISKSFVVIIQHGRCIIQNQKTKLIANYPSLWQRRITWWR